MYLSLILNVILRFYLPQKKTSELSFCSRFKMYVLMVSILPFAVKIIRLITSPAVKKVSFPQSRNFSPVKKLFHNQGTFSQSWKSSTIKELFQSWKFSIVKEILNKNNLLDQRNFPQTMTFSTVKEISHKNFFLIKQIFHKQESFPQNIFPWSRKFSTNKDFL